MPITCSCFDVFYSRWQRRYLHRKDTVTPLYNSRIFQISIDIRAEVELYDVAWEFTVFASSNVFKPFGQTVWALHIDCVHLLQRQSRDHRFEVRSCGGLRSFVHAQPRALRQLRQLSQGWNILLQPQHRSNREATLGPTVRMIQNSSYAHCTSQVPC